MAYEALPFVEKWLYCYFQTNNDQPTRILKEMSEPLAEVVRKVYDVIIFFKQVILYILYIANYFPS